MPATHRGLTRRALLGAAVTLPLAGCTQVAATSAEPTGPAPGTSAAKPAPQRHPRLRALERRFGARLGVYAVHTGTGASVAHRAAERFAFCSAFKVLATAAVLHHNPLSHLDTVVRYSPDELLPSAVITSKHVRDGMTIGRLCDAAVRYSDGTAGNLLLRDLGGPAAITRYARRLGDRVTRMDRFEPNIVTAIPGDPRDTSSPEAFGGDVRRLLLGDALPEEKRDFLLDLMRRSTTSERIRAGLPDGWACANKTGTGEYGTLNDFAVVWPPNSAPLLIALMSSMPAADAEYDEKLLAEATRYVLRQLG